MRTIQKSTLEGGGLPPLWPRSGRNDNKAASGRRTPRRITKAPLSLLMTIFLVGNVAAQKGPTFPVKTPDTFRDADATAATGQNSIGDLKWFEVFKDAELQKLVRTAMAQNYDLRAAVARVNAARANLGLARSDQFPQVVGSADVTTTHDSKNGQFGASPLSGRTRSFGNFFLNFLTFELDIWGRLRQQTKAAHAELRASEEDRKAVMTIVVSDVSTGYFSLLELDSELEIGKRTLAAREESLRLIQLSDQSIKAGDDGHADAAENARYQSGRVRMNLNRYIDAMILNTG